MARRLLSDVLSEIATHQTRLAVLDRARESTMADIAGLAAEIASDDEDTARDARRERARLDADLVVIGARYGAIEAAILRLEQEAESIPDPTPPTQPGRSSAPAPTREED